MAGMAIKDVMDLTLTPLSGSGEAIVINYLNGCSLSWNEESTSAKRKGRDTIIFGSPKTGELKIDAEVIEEDFLVLSMGGIKGADGTIEVASISPSTMYKAEGLFTVEIEGAGTEQRQMVLHSVKPKASGELGLNSEEVTSFSMSFDLASTEDDKFITWKKYKPSATKTAK